MACRCRDMQPVDVELQRQGALAAGVLLVLLQG